jgi:hypothetical protein
MTKSRTKAPRTTAVLFPPAEAARRIAIEAARYIERRNPPKRLGTGLAALVRAAFAQIADMRQKALTWEEVREVFRRAEVLDPQTDAIQLATEYRYQLRYREGRLRRRGKTVGLGRTVAAAGATMAPLPSPPRAPDPSDAADMTLPRELPIGINGPSIRLRDGREFPAGTKQVPLMAQEAWSAKQMAKYFGDASKAPLEPPMVDIENLMARTNSPDL